MSSFCNLMQHSYSVYTMFHWLLIQRNPYYKVISWGCLIIWGLCPVYAPGAPKKYITSYADDQHHGGHSPREINRQREQFDHYLNAHENTFIATQRAILYLVKMWERRRSEAELCTGLLSRTPTPWRLSPHHIFCTGLLEKKKQKTIYKFILGKPSRKPQYRNMLAQGETPNKRWMPHGQPHKGIFFG